MRMYDIIEKKRDGGELSDAEIGFFIRGYVAGEIPDYQASALLMAIFLRGMTDTETHLLTQHMMHSGDTVDLSCLPGAVVDKHSTGGVGDKATLIVAPLLAAMDPGHIFVPTMSGRGLAHTGGTLDKLESIPGFDVNAGTDAFIELVSAHGTAIVGQTGNLVPADKLLYALRDVTATVNSIPLIASSIMSKKLAEGTESLLLDVKVGSGAFMTELPDAVELARTMVAIGTQAGRNVKALVTNMDAPLGRAIGNSLEVAESARTLQGQGPADLTELCLMLAAHAAALTGRFTLEEAEVRARETLASGAGFEKLCEIVTAQGGEAAYVRDPSRFEAAPASCTVTAAADGYIGRIDTKRVGTASCELGAGRVRVEDPVDHRAGIELVRTRGDAVRTDEPIAILHASDEEKLAQGRATFEAALTYTACAPDPEPLLFAVVTADGVEYAR